MVRQAEQTDERSGQPKPFLSHGLYSTFPEALRWMWTHSESSLSRGLGYISKARAGAHRREPAPPVRGRGGEILAAGSSGFQPDYSLHVALEKLVPLLALNFHIWAMRELDVLMSVGLPSSSPLAPVRMYSWTWTLRYWYHQGNTLNFPQSGKVRKELAPLVPGSGGSLSNRDSTGLIW